MDIITKIILTSIIVVGLLYLFISIDLATNPCNYSNITIETRC